MQGKSHSPHHLLCITPLQRDEEQQLVWVTFFFFLQKNAGIHLPTQHCTEKNAEIFFFKGIQRRGNEVIGEIKPLKNKEGEICPNCDHDPMRLPDAESDYWSILRVAIYPVA